MRKAPFAILACVVLFLSVVLGVMLHRSRAPKRIAQEPVETRAEYRIKEVHLQEKTRDGSQWQLDAALAESIQGEGRTTLKKVTIRVDQPTRSWTVTADEGDLVDNSKDVELRGNVVLTTNDGLRLETARLRWAAAEQRAWTDEAVTIYRPGAVVRGSGFESRAADETTAIKGRVRATFGKGTSPGPGAAEAKKS